MKFLPLISILLLCTQCLFATKLILPSIGAWRRKRVIRATRWDTIVNAPKKGQGTEYEKIGQRLTTLLKPWQAPRFRESGRALVISWNFCCQQFRRIHLDTRFVLFSNPTRLSFCHI